MIKAILFDMDGILFDSEKYYMLGTYTWLKELGFQGEIEDLFGVIGTTMEETYQFFIELLEDKYTYQEIKNINENYFNSHKMDYKNIMFDGVDTCLQHLSKEGYRLACCSSSPKDNIIESLTEMGIIDCFEVILSGEEFEQSKPNPEIYLKACEKLGVRTSEAIVYEDSNRGIMAGINAGIITIARKEERFNLDQTPANYIVENIQGLEEKVKEINIWKK